MPGIRVGACRAANVPKIATVQQASNTTVCSGTQIGSYSSSPTTTCTACQQGPSYSSNLCGTSLGVPTYCCYRPAFLWTAAPNPQPTPTGTNIQAYPYITLPLPVRRCGRGAARSSDGGARAPGG